MIEIKVIYIASGQSVANSLKSDGYNNVFAFNEAMCEGDTCADIDSHEFGELRAKAYDISVSEYTHFGKELNDMLIDTDQIELFFDHDMFCAVNTITLLAYLEKIRFTGKINFNLIAQDGSATVLKKFPIKTDNFGTVYNSVLVERKPVRTGIEHLDKDIFFYLEYKKQDNKIVRYIKANIHLPRLELCKRILIDFADYGIGDSSIFKLIDNYTE